MALSSCRRGKLRPSRRGRHGAVVPQCLSRVQSSGHTVRACDRQGHCPREIPLASPLPPPPVSHRVAHIREWYLVPRRAEGTPHHYRLNGQGLGRINKLLATPADIAVLARDFAGDAWERKVLRDFFDGDRLKEIPAQEKKRLVILAWLADQFAWGRNYSEKEVNEQLARFHPDFASLRRYLVGHRFMEREHGVY